MNVGELRFKAAKIGEELIPGVITQYTYGRDIDFLSEESRHLVAYIQRANLDSTDALSVLSEIEDNTRLDRAGMLAYQAVRLFLGDEGAPPEKEASRR